MSLETHSTSGHLITAVIKQVAEAGHNVHVIQEIINVDNPYLPDYLTKIGVTTTGVNFKVQSKSNFAKRYLNEVNYIIRSARLIDNQYDAVFIQSNIAAGFSLYEIKKRCKKAFIVYNVQDVYPQDVYFAGKVGKNNLTYIAMKMVQKYAYKRASKIITISEDMKHTIEMCGIDSKKIEVVYNWSYKDQLFEEEDVSPEVAELFDKRFFNVVYAGNIGLFQNVDVVIDIAERMKCYTDIWFHIFGEGMYKNRLITGAHNKDIENITFHSILPHDLAPSIYSSASVNIIPLGKNQYRAALPSKTATCLACQKPILFLIGKESLFGQKVSKSTGCPLLDSDDIDGAVNSILSIKNGSIHVNTIDFYRENCQISQNSNLYKKIILQEK